MTFSIFGTFGKAATTSATTATSAALDAPVPLGFSIDLDATTRRIDQTTLFGGAPARVVRLSEPGQAALDELIAGPIRTLAGAILARRLTDAGIAHPVPPPIATMPSATVVIPVRDRFAELDRCLRALGTEVPVVVVDDASTDPARVARVVAAHGARVLHRGANGGPGPARNTALATIDTEFVVMLDSDCVPPPGWIRGLAAHLADPAVAIAAPRIVARPAPTALSRYSQVRSSLDLGDKPARVAPGTRVAYVPTAALVARVAALHDVARGAAVFEESLRYGEDVDLIWRLNAAGWRIRYDPSVQVQHEEPDTWPGLLRRRYSYGTSAAPLAARHPAETVPVVLLPWPTFAIAGVLAGRPAVAVGGVAGGLLTMGRATRRLGLPPRGLLLANLRMISQIWLGLGRYVTQFALPAVLPMLLTRHTTPWSRAALTALTVSPAVHTWITRRPHLDPARTALAQLADDTAYGAGVWAGCLRHRSLRALRPVLLRAPVRGTNPSPT